MWSGSSRSFMGVEVCEILAVLKGVLILLGFFYLILMIAALGLLVGERQHINATNK